MLLEITEEVAKTFQQAVIHLPNNKVEHDGTKSPGESASGGLPLALLRELNTIFGLDQEEFTKGSSYKKRSFF